MIAIREELKYRAWTTTSIGKANRQRVEQLRGRYSGRRCFVMGNGPSLLQCDVNRLADEVTIVSNAHYLIWDQLSFVPDFLLVEDVLVAEDRAKELDALEGITQVFPFDLHSRLGEANQQRLYLRFSRFYRPFPKFSFDLARAAYWGGTVSFLNIQLAAYLGCNPIVLIGFDHNYVLPTRDEKAGDVIVSGDKDMNHIHPNYFGPGYRWHNPNLARMEAAYRVAREALEARGIKVLNATVGGRLETFEHVSYDSLL